MPLQETLREWQNFYIATVGASAALIGLMFVAISLGSHLVKPETQQGIPTYVNPTLFHFVAVFITACVLLVPTHRTASLTIIVGLLSLVGLLPILSYALGCAAAVGIGIFALPDWLNALA